MLIAVGGRAKDRMEARDHAASAWKSATGGGTSCQTLAESSRESAYRGGFLV